MIKVFVYGTLKPEGSNYRLCRDFLIDKQEAYTYGNLYALPQGYPAMTYGGQKVYGYLYIFSEPKVLKGLDQLERYSQKNDPNNLYEREKVPIYNLMGDSLGEVWTYIMSEERVHAYQGTLLSSGRWNAS